MINKLSTYLLKPRNGRRGIIFMSIVAFTEAIFFPIPPDPFLGFLCIKKSYRRVLHIVTICLFFSIFGGCVGYVLGEEIINFAIKSDFGPIVNNLDKIEPLKNDINEETFLLMLASGFTPLPFKLLDTITSLGNVISQLYFFEFSKISFIKVPQSFSHIDFPTLEPVCFNIVLAIPPTMITVSYTHLTLPTILLV